MKKLFVLVLALGVHCATLLPVYAQSQTTQQPTTEELEREQAEREQNAYRLLEQVVDEAQSLRLTENRVRVQINAADMLWKNNQGRARSLFAMASDGVVELSRSTQPSNNRRGGPSNSDRRAFQLRQELVLTAARHDAPLAYQLLAATKPATPFVENTDNEFRGPRPSMDSESNLEQLLLGRIAALDPKLAAQNAEQMMEKGQFPRSLTEVLNQLHRQDAEAAEKLGEKTVRRLQATNILANNETTSLVQSLLSPGPRTQETKATAATTTVTSSRGRTPVLEQSAYVELLSTVIDLTLKATSLTQNVQRTIAPRGRAARGPISAPAQNRTSEPPTEAQAEQNSARRLLAGLQGVLPLLDQYLPAKAPLVRQKLNELVMTNSISSAFPALGENPSSELLVETALTAPPQVQSRLYQQAAYRAVEEGNLERARQIANDHLQENARDSVMQRIKFREVTQKAEGARLEEIRQTIAKLQSDNDKLNLLLRVSRDMQKTNPQLSLQLLEDAKQITSRRASSYEHFEQQLRVASAFAAIDPGRSFEVLDPAISQINELLSAANMLNGFEVNMFRDGEMMMSGGGGLSAIINRFGQELATLARHDIERAETLAGRFQLAEARVMTRLAIVRGLLDLRRNPAN